MDIWTLCKKKKITLEELKTAKGNINNKNKYKSTPFHHICSKGISMEILKYCCEVLKADINDKDNTGFTPFHYICISKIDMEILSYCCEVLTADINVMSNSGSTPFRWLYRLH